MTAKRAFLTRLYNQSLYPHIHGDWYRPDDKIADSHYHDGTVGDFRATVQNWPSILSGLSVTSTGPLNVTVSNGSFLCEYNPPTPYLRSANGLSEGPIEVPPYLVAVTTEDPEEPFDGVIDLTTLSPVLDGTTANYLYIKVSVDGKYSRNKGGFTEEIFNAFVDFGAAFEVSQTLSTESDKVLLCSFIGNGVDNILLNHSTRSPITGLKATNNTLNLQSGQLLSISLANTVVNLYFDGPNRDFIFPEQGGVLATEGRISEVAPVAVAAISKDSIGFPPQSEYDSTLIFQADGPQALITIQPTPGNTHFTTYDFGQLRLNEHIQVAVPSGGKYVMLNSDDTVHVGEIPSMDKRLVSYTYYNPNSPVPFVIDGDERHQAMRNTTWHGYTHRNKGMVAPFDIGIAYTLNDDTSVRFEINSGVRLEDEDLIHIVTHSDPSTLPMQQVLTPYAHLPVMWKQEDMIRMSVPTSFPYLSGNVRLGYNEGGDGISDVPNGKYVNYYLIGSNARTHTLRMVMGQNVYDTLDEAQLEFFNNIGLPLPEVFAFRQFTLHVDDSYDGNAFRCRIAGVQNVSKVLGQSSGFSANRHNEMVGRNGEDGPVHPASAVNDTLRSQDVSASLTELYGMVDVTIANKVRQLPLGVRINTVESGVRAGALASCLSTAGNNVSISASTTKPVRINVSAGPEGGPFYFSDIRRYGYEANVDNIPEWSNQADGTYYLYEQVDVITGVVSRGTSSSPPYYGVEAPATPAVGQWWLRIDDYTPLLFNGTDWIKTPRVYIGELVVASGVAYVITYAYNGEAITPFVAISTSVVVNRNHNLGTNPELIRYREVAKVVAAAGGYSVGDIIIDAGGPNYFYEAAPYEVGSAAAALRNTSSISYGNYQLYLGNAKGGGFANLVKVNVNVQHQFNRGF